MHAPVVALTWEFWRRHRLGLSAVGALVLGFAVATAISPLSKTTATIHSMWLVLGLCYVIGVFAYGFEGRLETAASGFPVRLFLLPVRTWVLVGWPMVQGIVVAVLLWLAWDSLVLRPCGIEAPAWWPVMLAAVVVTSQALVWLPFGVPWLRLLVSIVVLTLLIRAPALLALAGGQFAEPESANRVLSAFAASLVPLAFLVAWAGVSRARQGTDPDRLWAWRSVRFPRLSRREPRPFSSALAAQVWYEWRTRGRGFVVTVLLVVAALAMLAVLLEREATKQTNFGVMFLLAPVLLAPFWSTYAGLSGASVREPQLTAFAATRPLSNSALVGAKIRAAGRAAVTAWGVVLVAFAVWLLYTGGFRELRPVWEAAGARYGTGRVIGVCTLFVGGLLALTWRMLVVGLWAGLTGRVWVPAIVSIATGIVGLQLLFEWILLNADPVRQERILQWLPWAAGGAVVLKVVVSGWAVRVLLRRGELQAGALVQLLGLWLVVAAGLFSASVWLISSDQVPLYGLALGAVLFVPFGRLALAPLALGWNRQR